MFDGVDVLVPPPSAGYDSRMPKLTSLGGRLTAKEDAALRRCEDVIETANNWDIERAKALCEIRDRHLYRSEFRTFEQYVTRRWGISRPHAYRLIEWVTTIENVASVSPNGDILSEGAARPLYGLTPAQQRDAVRRSQKGQSLYNAAESVRAAVRARKDQSARQQAGRDPRVICADVHEGLRLITNGTVALVVTSPPYAAQRSSHYPSVSEAEYPEWTVRWMAALRPKLTDDASVLIVIRPHVENGQVSDYVLRTRLALRDDGWNECDELIWFKPDSIPLGNKDRPRRSWESVLWFSPSRRPFCDSRANGKLATRFGFRSKRSAGHADDHPIYASSREDAEGRSRTPDVFRALAGERREEPVLHPAIFPIGLVEQLVVTFSRTNDLVLDPFAGAGNTLLAAEKLKRRAAGIEIVPRYAALIERRLSSCGAES